MDGDGLLHFLPVGNTELSLCFVLLVISTNCLHFVSKIMHDYALLGFSCSSAWLVGRRSQGSYVLVIVVYVYVCFFHQTYSTEHLFLVLFAFLKKSVYMLYFMALIPMQFRVGSLIVLSMESILNNFNGFLCIWTYGCCLDRARMFPTGSTSRAEHAGESFWIWSVDRRDQPE